MNLLVKQSKNPLKRLRTIHFAISCGMPPERIKKMWPVLGRLVLLARWLAL